MARRILVISLVYYPEFVGGAEVAVREITNRLGGYKFDMLTLRGSSTLSEEVIGNVRVIRLGSRVDMKTFWGRIVFKIQKYLFPFLVLRKGSMLFKKDGYDIIWSIMANYAGFGALFLKWRFSSVKFLLTLQEGDPIPYIKRRVFFVYPIFKMIFKKADMVQAISKYLARFALSMKARNVAVIPNGVDIGHFTKKEQNAFQTIRENFQIGERDVVLVTTSRLVKKNGVSHVIEALRYLPEHYVFVIVGDGELRASFEHLATRLGLSKRVVFTGYVPHQELPKFFSASDIFIRASLSEGLGNSFLEAMAFGLPVVATPVGGIVDFLKDGETGILVKPSDPQSIAEGIMRLADKKLASHVREFGKNLVFQDYDWNSITPKFKKIFDTL